MLKSRLCDLVGIRYPIIQAGMGPFPNNNLCVAAANAGVPGLVGTSGLATRERQPEILVDAVYDGDRGKAMFAAGEVAQRINDLPGVSDLVQEIVKEAEGVLRSIPAKYLAL